MRHTDAEHDALARDFNRDGLVVLEGHFPRATLERWREGFEPLLAAQVAREQDTPHRGTQRFYVTLPFQGLFAAPRISNTTDEHRPMVVLGYSRRWLRRPEVHIRIPRSVWERLTPTGRPLPRVNPVVPDDQVLAAEESYRQFAY